jgi:sugar phosphate isomerase/epimerase
MSGYDGWLSIEHEDVMLSREEGMRKSVELLRNVMPAAKSDFKPQEF